ncbi:MAG: alpha/beta hydrolase [Magnetococcales bacterium]|nr:alpha/beta hydrolase [Magnetococcales bacterium]
MLLRFAAPHTRLIVLAIWILGASLTVYLAMDHRQQRELEIICRHDSSGRYTILARLPQAPFPYEGSVGDTDQPFFDHLDPFSGQRFHTTGDGIRYPESPHYRDNRVLIHLPPFFQSAQPFAILVFFHGHQTEIRQTLIHDLDLVQQINSSGRNLVLVAPQLVLQAADSSPGKLYRTQGFSRMLEDVAQVLRPELGDAFAARFRQAPVWLTAYSGGYRAAAYTLDRGFDQDQKKRLQGVILLDALYGELEKFFAWMQQPGAHFINLYGPSTRPLSSKLQERVRTQGQSWSTTLPDQEWWPGWHFLSVPTPHQKLFRDGPPPWPLKEILARLPEKNSGI